MNHLRWMGHATTIFEMQRNLRNDMHSCEITLVAKGHSVRAHRFVLCSCSDLLRGLIEGVPVGQEATIIVPDIRGPLLESVVSFVYLGETSLTSANLTEFLEAINLLGIKSAISFECSTSSFVPNNSNALNSANTIKTIADIQIVHEELIPQDKIENHQLINEAETDNERPLEFLDVYGEEPVEHKITYSIEELSAPSNSSEFIINETSGTYTLTSNTKLEHVSCSGSDKTYDVEGIVTEDSIDNDSSPGADIIEDLSNGTDPLLEISGAHSNTDNLIISASNASATLNVPSNRIIHIKSSNLKAVKLKSRTSLQHHSHINENTHHLLDEVVEYETKQHIKFSIDAKDNQIENLSDPISLTEDKPSSSHELNIELAVHDVIAEGISLQKAAQKYNISKTVLWRRVRKNPNYMKNSRENPILKVVFERLKDGDSLKNISRDLDIPMSTLHRHKVRLAQEGRLPKYVTFKKRGSMTKDELREKLSKAVYACVHDGMSQNKSANLFDIPKSTLWRHLQKRSSDVKISKENTTMDIKEEAVLS